MQLSLHQTCCHRCAHTSALSSCFPSLRIASRQPPFHTEGSGVSLRCCVILYWIFPSFSRTWLSDTVHLQEMFPIVFIFISLVMPLLLFSSIFLVSSFWRTHFTARWDMPSFRITLKNNETSTEHDQIDALDWKWVKTQLMSNNDTLKDLLNPENCCSF